jgi:hypothetical protein
LPKCHGLFPLRVLSFNNINLSVLIFNLCVSVRLKVFDLCEHTVFLNTSLLCFNFYIILIFFPGLSLHCLTSLYDHQVLNFLIILSIYLQARNMTIRGYSGLIWAGKWKCLTLSYFPSTCFLITPNAGVLAGQTLQKATWKSW